MCMKVFVALCGEMMQWFCIDVCHIVIFFSCHLRPCLSVFDGLFKCFLCQGSNVQSSKPNRSFSKNCPEFTGNPSKIKFFWSFLLMSACDCKSWRKFNFCNQFRVQQNIFERYRLWTFLPIRWFREPSSRFLSITLTQGRSCQFCCQITQCARDFFQN
jgi:hypothetical protein